MSSLNKALLKEIEEAGPLHLTKAHEAFLRSVTFVDWEKVDLANGTLACAMFGEDPRSEKGKGTIIAMSLVSYFKDTLGSDLLPLLNQIIEAWKDEGVERLKITSSDEEIERMLAHNRAAILQMEAENNQIIIS